MAKLSNIGIGKESQNFVLTGDTDVLLNNPRLFFSLKRLGIRQENGKILIPFSPGLEINTLQELQQILQKFDLADNLSTEVKKDSENYYREQINFSNFSDNARDIRNNQFTEKPELIDQFRSFQSMISTKLLRKLYPLQLLSAYHMAFAQNSCNFSVPGAGKTGIVYAAYAYLKNLPTNDPKHVDKLMVIGPLSSFRPWEKEYFESFGIEPEVQRLSGDQKIQRSHKEEHLFSGNPAEITLIYHGGVESLEKEIISFLKRNKTMVVVDEAHRIKNPDGVWGKSIVEIGKQAIARVILTGTPVPNGYEDLFNLYQYVYPFKYKEILNFHYGNLVEMTKNADLDSDRVKELIQNISPYFIRIKKSDLMLPPIAEHTIEVDMDRYQREIYDFIETKYIKSFQLNKSANVKDVLNKARLIRLRQAATNPSLLLKPIQETLNSEDFESRVFVGGQMPDEFQDNSEILYKISNYSKLETPKKFNVIKDLLSDKIKNKEKVIVWTIFIQNAKGLQKYLLESGIHSGLLIGEVDQPERESLIERFNNPNDLNLQVLIANPFSVAESISLHKGCHNAVYMERDYNCSNFIQSKDRIHRVGLPPNQTTNYYYILSKDSIDEVINEKLQIKTKRMEKIIDEDIPLFSIINDDDETDLIKALIDDYAKRA